MRRARFISVIIIAGFAVAMLYIWQQTQALRLGYTVADLKTKRDKLVEENASLQMKISSFRSLEKLDETAKKRGLIIPDASRTVYLEGE